MKRLKVTLLPAAAAAAAPSPADVLAARWARLHAFIASVHALRAGGAPPPRFSFEELHSDVVDVCSLRQAPELFARLRGAWAARVEALLDGLGDDAAGAGVLLARVADAWGAHNSEVALTKAVFLHLDRSHVADVPGARSLGDVGVALWGRALAAREALLARVVRSACELVARERAGESVDRATLAAVVRMLLSTALFDGALVEPVLAATRDFYADDALRSLAALDVPEYLLHAEARMRREVRARRAARRAATRAPSAAARSRAPAPPPRPPPPSIAARRRECVLCDKHGAGRGAAAQHPQLRRRAPH